MNDLLAKQSRNDESKTQRSSDTLPRRVASTKIKQIHFDRRAVVYIRQSSPQQVINHTESTARQYALVDRAVDLGWNRDSVTVIDEDQGQSGKSSVTRLGFQNLLAEVSLDHVGIIFGIEMSRLARSCKDWHQLLELCGVFRTLLADADGIYDPTDYNDRLLLGLKGTMSEAELHILKSRMYEGKRNKARRGELLVHPPIGYVRDVSRRDYEFDPDEQAQAVVRLIFEVFEEQGSLHGLLRYLVANEIQMPVRPHHGPNRGQLEWRRPNRMTLQNVLRNPIYAGAYRWGYRKIDPRKQQPGRVGTGRTVNRAEDCEVLIKDRFPAYITWERFQAIGERLDNNRAIAAAQGAPREGVSLLGGLAVCGRCQRSLMPAYSGKANRLRYTCGRAMIDYGEPICLGLTGEVLDEFVAGQVMKVLTPASLELSLAAEANIETQRSRLDQQWRQRVERATYEAELAARQYATVEPENRLVARELERRWEESLQKQKLVEEEYERFSRETPSRLTDGERSSIRELATEIPFLWEQASTTSQQRQEIVRCLLDRVVINVEGESEQVEVTLCWCGGFESHHRLVRPVRRYDQLSNYDELIGRIDALREQGETFASIAEHLDVEGFRPPKRAAKFTGGMISRLLSKRGLHGPRPRSMSNTEWLKPDEFWLTDFARHMKIPVATIHSWQRKGWLHSRKVNVAGGRWAIWANAAEQERLRQLRQYKRRWPHPTFPETLTTPLPKAAS